MRRSPYREMKKQDTEYTRGARAHLSRCHQSLEIHSWRGPPLWFEFFGEGIIFVTLLEGDAAQGTAFFFGSREP